MCSRTEATLTAPRAPSICYTSRQQMLCCRMQATLTDPSKFSICHTSRLFICYNSRQQMVCCRTEAALTAPSHTCRQSMMCSRKESATITRLQSWASHGLPPSHLSQEQRQLSTLIHGALSAQTFPQYKKAPVSILHRCSLGGLKGDYRYSPGYSEVLKTGYSEVLKTNRMYRPWYQFAIGYIPVWPASTERGLYANLGTSRYWKPTKRTNLDTSLLWGTYPWSLLQQTGLYASLGTSRYWNVETLVSVCYQVHTQVACFNTMGTIYTLTWVLQGIEIQQNVQTLIPFRSQVQRSASTEWGLYSNMGTSRYWKPTACTDLDTSSLPGTYGYFKALKANSMYRPWYQFTTGYVWVLQGTESQQHVQTSMPVRWRTGRMPLGTRNRLPLLGGMKGRSFPVSCKGIKTTSRLQSALFLSFFAVDEPMSQNWSLYRHPHPSFVFFSFSISRMHQTLHPTINCLYQRKLPECAAIITKTFMTFSASPTPPPPEKEGKKAGV